MFWESQRECSHILQLFVRNSWSSPRLCVGLTYKTIRVANLFAMVTSKCVITHTIKFQMTKNQRWISHIEEKCIIKFLDKGKVFYGPVENLLPQNVGSIINYLQQFTEVAQRWAHSCSRPQPAMNNGVRDGRSNWLVALPTLHRAVPSELHVLHSAMLAANNKTCCTHWAANVRPSECEADALPVRPLMV